jgi:hypothetical protein
MLRAGRGETTWSYRDGRLAPSRLRVLRPMWTSPVRVLEAFAEPSDHELLEESDHREGSERVKLRLTSALQFDISFIDMGVATKRNVKVTLTIPQLPTPLIQTRTIRRITPYSSDGTLLHFGNLVGVRPGRTWVVIRIELPGATPIRYPVTFTRG